MSSKLKMLALLSGGIDSPVSCYLTKGNANVGYFHVSGRGSLDRIIRIIKVLEFSDSECISSESGKIILYTIEHDRLMSYIKDFMVKNRISDGYTCVYCKRAMLKCAEMLAGGLGFEAILTGDNLGQVASQTVQNLYAEEISLKIPVIRPLIGYDKEEIVSIAKKAGTYEISIEKGELCRFLPHRPITKAKEDKIKPFGEDFGKLVDDIREIRLGNDEVEDFSP